MIVSIVSKGHTDDTDDGIGSDLIVDGPKLPLATAYGAAVQLLQSGHSGA